MKWLKDKIADFLFKYILEGELDEEHRMGEIDGMIAAAKICLECGALWMAQGQNVSRGAARSCSTAIMHEMSKRKSKLKPTKGAQQP